MKNKTYIIITAITFLIGIAVGSIGRFLYVKNTDKYYNRSVNLLHFNSTLNLFWALSNDNVERAKYFVAKDVRTIQKNMIKTKDIPDISSHIDSLINVALKYNDRNDNVPQGLLELIHQIKIDPFAPWGFNDMGFDSTVTFDDIHFGTPINIYYVLNEKLLLPSDLPTNTYIYKTTKWFIPVYDKDRCVRSLYARSNKDKWIFCESSCCAYSNAWQKFREKWPEECSPTPIIIDWDQIWLIHFPEIDSFNLIYLMGSEDNKYDYKINRNSSDVIHRMSTILKNNIRFNFENPCVVDPEKCSDKDEHEHE